MNLHHDHARCIVAHALTKLHKAGEISRSKAHDVHFNSFRYYPKITMTIKKTIADILARHGEFMPLSEMQQKLDTSLGRKINASKYLTEMFQQGVLLREKKYNTATKYHTYFYKINWNQPVPQATTPSPRLETESAAVFATFSDGRAIVETSAARIELTAAEAAQLRGMLNAAAPN